MTYIISSNDAKDAGMKEYFTGKPCVKGHISPRRVLHWKCVECGTERDRSRVRAEEEFLRTVGETVVAHAIRTVPNSVWALGGAV